MPLPWPLARSGVPLKHRGRSAETYAGFL